MNDTHRSIASSTLPVLLVSLGCASSVGAPAAADGSDPKALVTTAIEAVFNKHDGEAIDRYFTEEYLQHNPHVPSGRESMRGFLSNDKIRIERVRVLADGDLVVTHSTATGFTPEPVVAFDIFRVEGGKIAEHWDVLQPVAAQTASGRSQTDGPTEIVDRTKTTENKRLIQRFFDDVLYGHQMDKIPQYISTETYHQHNPGVADGIDGFGKAMAELQKAGLTMEYKKTYRIVAEGNLVFTHSEGIFAGRHVAFADLFRIDDGKIVEHWDVIQDVPETTASGLGMF